MIKLITANFILLFMSDTMAQIYKVNTKNHWQNSRYINNSNGTVVDKKTGLMWKKCTEGQMGNNCEINVALSYTWSNSLEIAKNSTFANYTDWRLPNIKELKSLVAYDRYDPSINTDIFPYTLSKNYWSSSPYVYFHDDLSWSIFFMYGNDKSISRKNKQYIRLVR